MKPHQRPLIGAESGSTGVVVARVVLGWVVLGWAVCGVPVFALMLSGCDDSKQQAAPATVSSGPIMPTQLTAELAGRVLAQVGGRTITLGDYAAALDRMDQFERLRYQTPERRKQLLDELINMELLAREAEKRGLDKSPETQERLRQLLREEVLRRRRETLPKLEELPMGDVRAYYDSHRDELREPERRRVGHIALKDRAKAEQVLAQARTATPAQWGELVKRNATQPEQGDVPIELAGDLGFVSPPGTERGSNLNVPEPLREAVFKLSAVGDVSQQLVLHEGEFHVVRLMGISAARDRTFAEAERTVRVQLLQEMVAKSERALLDELRKTTPVTINEAALSRVKTAAEPKP
jgi:parvulin-like peptidyl-prolyl isomerase